MDTDNFVLPPGLYALVLDRISAAQAMSDAHSSDFNGLELLRHCGSVIIRFTQTMKRHDSASRNTNIVHQYSSLSRRNGLLHHQWNLPQNIGILGHYWASILSGLAWLLPQSFPVAQ